VEQSQVPVDSVPPAPPRLFLSFPLSASLLLMQSIGWGSTQGLCSFLKRHPRLCPGSRDGFQPPLHFPPPLTLPGPHFSTPYQGKNDHYINKEVEALLSTGAIKEVPLSPPCYISTIFLIPKKSGSMRPILNLKKLNAAHLDTPYFRMETIKDVCHPLRPGDRAAYINLRDAYFHVPLHPSTRKYMCFGWKGRLFQFCVLPYGLSPAPKVFTSLTRFIKMHFGSRR
jgi:hypothetical protein